MQLFLKTLEQQDWIEFVQALLSTNRNLCVHVFILNALYIMGTLYVYFYKMIQKIYS